MWNNFCAVVLDLYLFAFGRQQEIETVVYKGSFLPVGHGARQPILLSPAVSKQPILLQSTSPKLIAPENKIAAPTPVSKRVDPAPIEDVKQPSSAILHAPVVMYVVAESGTDCINAPQLDFDAVIEKLPYGTAVTVIGYTGRFASVNRSNITGWVLKDDISPQKNNAWPLFVAGTDYEADHVITRQTRLLIDDMFGAGVLNLPLQAGEYIAVRLKSEHRAIPWSRKRPRIAGQWAALLRGTPGVHIGISPKTDSIIEWKTSDGEGRLGYVEAVTPDQAITIGVVGEGEAGHFSVKTMSEEVWRELRPVFIELV